MLATRLMKAVKTGGAGPGKLMLHTNIHQLKCVQQHRTLAFNAVVVVLRDRLQGIRLFQVKPELRSRKRVATLLREREQPDPVARYERTHR